MKTEEEKKLSIEKKRLVVKNLLETGLLHSIKDIFIFIPVKTVYENIGLSLPVLNNLIKNTEEIRLKQLISLSNYFEVNPKIAIKLAYLQYQNDRKEKVEKYGLPVTKVTWRERMLEKNRLMVKNLLEQGSLHSIQDIFAKIRFRDLYKEFAISFNTLRKFIAKPEEMKLRHLTIMSEYFEVDLKILIYLAYLQYKTSTKAKQQPQP